MLSGSSRCSAWLWSDKNAIESTESTRATADSVATIHMLDGQDLRGPLTAESNRIVRLAHGLATTTMEGYVLVSGPGRVHPHFTRHVDGLIRKACVLI
jgi:hypothetical protein